MSQTLKRPMFRKGGPVMEGIMDGIVDRQQMQTGGDTIGGGVIQGQDMGNNRTGFATPTFIGPPTPTFRQRLTSPFKTLGRKEKV